MTKPAFESWLGHCHFVRDRDDKPPVTATNDLTISNDTTEDLTGVVAIWAGDRRDFEEKLNACLAGKEGSHPAGLHLLWAEDVMPAAEWMVRHAHEKQAFELARKVHENHSVEFGPLIAPTEENPTSTDFLMIEEKEIAPLPDQTGIPFWDKQWITPDLKEALFAQPLQGENIRTYLIVDATLRKNVTNTFDLDDVDVPVRCLFKGDAAEEMKEVAPYIVDMTLPEGAWDDPTKVPVFHKNFFEKHWGQNTGIIFRAKASLEEMRTHFRKFTKVPDQSGKLIFFRYWVPTTFYPMGKYLRNSPKYAHVFFPQFVTEAFLDHPVKQKWLQFTPSEPRMDHRKLIIEAELEEKFRSFVRHKRVIKLLNDVEKFLGEKEPELATILAETPKSKQFGIGKNLYRLKILDVMQASAIMSIIHRTGINILSEKAFDYATKNPFLSPGAKARQLVLGFKMVTKMKENT
jgi:hypothetical protein